MIHQLRTESKFFEDVIAARHRLQCGTMRSADWVGIVSNILSP